MMSAQRMSAGGCSSGHAPLRETWDRASPSESSGDPDAVRQTRAPGAAETASRSRARKVGAEARAMSRPLWRSRTPSGASSRTARGAAPLAAARAAWRRPGGRRRDPGARRRWSAVGEGDGGVLRQRAVPAEADRVVEVGDRRREPVDHGDGVEPLEEDAPPVRGDGPGAQQLGVALWDDRNGSRSGNWPGERAKAAASRRGVLLRAQRRPCRGAALELHGGATCERAITPS